MPETVTPIQLDPPGSRISYAQNGEDVRLWRAFDGVEKGFYVEVGGWDPEVDSISRSFYGRGWSGIVVEPVAEFAQRYRAARPRDEVITAMAGGAPGRGALHAFTSSGLSTSLAEQAELHRAQGEIAEVRECELVTLTDVLASCEAGTIHFMVVDVEGAEAEVLRGLDLERFRPQVLVIEATLPRSREQSHTGWEPRVLASDYQFATFDGINRFYVARECASLVPPLQDPPNALDGFVWRHSDALAREVERLTGQLGDSLAQLAALRSQREMWTAERATLHRHIEAVSGDRDGWVDRARLLEAEVAQLAEEVGRWSARGHAAEDALDSVLASRSWRLTAPFRRVLGSGTDDVTATRGRP